MHRPAVRSERDRALAENPDQVAQARASDQIEHFETIECAHHCIANRGFLGPADQNREKLRDFRPAGCASSRITAATDSGK